MALRDKIRLVATEGRALFVGQGTITPLLGSRCKAVEISIGYLSLDRLRAMAAVYSRRGPSTGTANRQRHHITTVYGHYGIYAVINYEYLIVINL